MVMLVVVIVMVLVEMVCDGIDNNCGGNGVGGSGNDDGSYDVGVVVEVELVVVVKAYK